MSMLPRSFYNDPYEMEPRFGMGLLPSDFFSDRIISRNHPHHYLPTGYYRPWQVARETLNELNKDQKVSQIGENGFEVCVDVQHFHPEEIDVRVHDNTVVVEGKHEERDDEHGQIQRHFVRKYVLPKGFDGNSVQSTLSSDGVLTIKAPPPAIEGSQPRRLEITHTNAPSRIGMKYHNKKPNETNGTEHAESMETK
ncbi:hypothetical protein PVAND_017126 [Polypedilum vanderplanki]|uniref:SHSP domain-containing protein n=1 Tax=Polypedilum vanderplanki TaxID=319348 RepID=A0A9J6BHP9_POLVA|nr:hypothetical protein PVAND_017126 [Polypedilum vanderplanki]